MAGVSADREQLRMAGWTPEQIQALAALADDVQRDQRGDPASQMQTRRAWTAGFCAELEWLAYRWDHHGWRPGGPQDGA